MIEFKDAASTGEAGSPSAAARSEQVLHDIRELLYIAALDNVAYTDTTQGRALLDDFRKRRVVIDPVQEHEREGMSG